MGGLPQHLSNTYKHSITAGLGKNVYGVNNPTITLLGVIKPDRNLSSLTYHNHSFRQIIMGLREYLDDFFNRLQQNEQKNDFDRVESCFNHTINGHIWYLNAPYGS